MVSAIGSQFARVGLYVQVYALTGSPAAVGLLGVSGLIGSFGGVLVGSAFIDRHDRRVTLIWTELAAVGVSGVLFAGALAGDPPLWLLHAATSTPGRFTDVAVLTGANLFVTVMRFVAMRVWVFAPTLIRLSA